MLWTVEEKRVRRTLVEFQSVHSYNIIIIYAKKVCRQKKTEHLLFSNMRSFQSDIIFLNKFCFRQNPLSKTRVL